MNPLKKVAIVIITHKPTLSAYEKISLLQCVKVLGEKYPIYVVCPKGIDVSEYLKVSNEIKIDFVHPRWLKDYRSFNRFKLHPILFNRFKSFEYILFYELDAFVFRDELEHWTNCGYDYIGAPWFEGWDKGQQKENADFIGVGNGGFSLRKVKSSLKVLNTLCYIRKPTELIQQWGNYSFYRKLRHFPGLLLNLTVRNNTLYLFNQNSEEDKFWGLTVKSVLPWFNIAPAHDALRFSFEVNPRKLFILNNSQLPFGCHAWWRHDLDFWKPFIEKEGYTFS